MNRHSIFAIFIILLVGCASRTITPAKNPVTLLQIQSRSEAIEIPPPAITRVPQNVYLRWVPPPEPDASQIASYNLYYATSPDFCGMSIIPLGNVTNSAVTDLVGGVQYYFAVTDISTNGYESDFSPVLPYVPRLVMDLMFAFNQPVTNVVLQASPDLIHWQDLGVIPTNGIWRVTADTNFPVMIYRSAATTIPQ